MAFVVLGAHLAVLLGVAAARLERAAPTVIAPTAQRASIALLPGVMLPPVPGPALTPPLPRPALRSPAQEARAAPGASAASAQTVDTLALLPRSRDATQAEPAGAAVEVPVYATRLPPAGQWRYRLQRGPVQGEAALEWAPQADAGYTLRLQGRVAGVTTLDWASQGQFDIAGMAPERFAVRQRGRDRHAANFQREAGKISFSGPTHELALLRGAQDRLSWMIQLPAIIAAAPERFPAGASVVLFVAGARGGADVWTFAVQGRERLGAQSALKLVREPQRLYDNRIEVWLDPAAHYLPLRIVQTPAGGGAALELQREPD